MREVLANGDVLVCQKVKLGIYRTYVVPADGISEPDWITDLTDKKTAEEAFEDELVKDVLDMRH